MHRVISILSTALSIASFPSEDVKESTNELLESLGKDLAESGYVEDTTTNKLSKELAETIEEFSSNQKEEVEQVLNAAEPSENDEEEEEVTEDKHVDAEINWDVLEQE